MKYDNLIAGDFTMVKSTVDIGGDQDLKMGCVLARKTVSAGAKGKYSFALTSFTAAVGTLSVTIDGTSFSVDSTAESTLDALLTSLATAVNADSTCAFAATADTENDKFVLEANTVGAWAGESEIAMDKTGITVTIGDKTTEVEAADKSNGEYYAVDSSKNDGTQIPRAVLIEDVAVESGDVGKAVVAFTGEFNKSKLSFGGSDTWATHFDAMRDRCMFVKEIVE